MKPQHLILNLSLFFSVGSLFAQSNQTERLFIPFLDKESQSNVIVNVSDLFGRGKPCPMTYTNKLSNTNLFTLEEQNLLEEVFVKYKNVTTNSGPAGTVLVSLNNTNYVVKAMNKTVDVEKWIGRYQYTNSDAVEDVTIGSGMLAKYRTKSNNGYNVYISCVGGGATTLRFMEVKHNIINGVLAEFDDSYAQGVNWDYKLANFSDSHLAEYRQYTNGMVLGNFFMWNLRNNNLILEAEFKEPYDWQKNYRPFQ